MKQPQIVTTDDSSPSGYTEELNDEMGGQLSMGVEQHFTQLQPFYVSSSGHARLFRAMRYGKHYMLKCLKEDFLYTPVYRQALTKEFEIGVTLEHPYICRTIGMEQVEGLGMSIVLEYVDGDTLDQMMKRGLLTRKLALRIARQLCEALAYMHSKQILHRDLKPSNIMVTHNGHQLKLIDFSLSDSDAFSVLKCPAGTSGYIAPEMLQGEGKPDLRIDVYSLGVVFLKMAEASGETLLRQVGNICMAERPEQRPESMEAVLALLRQVRSQRYCAMLLLVVAAVLMLVVVGMMVYRVQASQTPSVAVTDSISADGNRVVDYSDWSQQR